MKQRTSTDTAKAELLYLKKQIEITEKKIGFTNDPRLLDALSYELLGLKARMSYLFSTAEAV